MRAVLSTLAFSLLIACTSAPPLVQSYSLSQPVEATPSAGTRLQFRLLSVAVPERLNTEVILAESQNGALYELANQIWASPLPDELRSTLSYQLSQQLPATDVTYIAADPNRPVYRVRVAVQQFATVVGARTTLAASWSISGGEIAANCSGSYSQNLAEANTVDIASFRQLAMQLSNDIGKSMQRYERGKGC